MLVIFDVDGTLADCRHRLHYIKPGKTADGKKIPRRFDLFEDAVDKDTVIHQVADIYLRMVNDPAVTVVLLTGRGEAVRYKTTKWFTDNGLDGYDALYMKTQKYQPDTEQKEALFHQITKDFGQAPVMVFEDRARVVAMWKRLGLFVVNVDQGEEDA